MYYFRKHVSNFVLTHVVVATPLHGGRLPPYASSPKVFHFLISLKKRAFLGGAKLLMLQWELIRREAVGLLTHLLSPSIFSYHSISNSYTPKKVQVNLPEKTPELT